MVVLVIRLKGASRSQYTTHSFSILLDCGKNAFGGELSML
uniref:Uncharacterized protein n=1 Tax=Rhizophora mucronata TaxID=61149 RepID=A0A2P2J1A2_RHIMU